jgi:ankyrin repeat protein
MSCALDVPLTRELAAALRADNEREMIAICGDSAAVFLVDESGHFDAILRDRPPLLSACAYFGAIRCLECLLSLRTSCVAPDGRGRRPCHFAAAGNRVRALARIRDALPIAELLSTDEDGCDVCHFAAEADALDIFRYLFVRVKSPAIFDAESRRGTPLQIACRHRSIKCFRFLAELNIAAAGKPPIDFNRPSTHSALIILLLKSRAYELIPIAIRAGMDPDANIGNGWPPLFHAVAIRAENVARALCRMGASVNWRCAAGWTPFHVAARERNTAACRLLWDFGGCPHTLTQFGFSPFTLALPLHGRFLRMCN